MEQELRKLLKQVPGYYEDFETAMVLLVREDKKAMYLLVNYLNDNPTATISDIGQYAYDIGDQTSDNYEEND
ncbi:MAG: hypothetical protein RR365_12660 [Bacteroides sp.]